MMRLCDHVLKVRSKNAGPFWVTMNVFCSSAAAIRAIAGRLDTAQVVERYHADAASLKRFEKGDLHIIKFSIPRPVV